MTPTRKPDRFPCPGCSGDMAFDPQTGGMKCPFCGRTEAVPAATSPGDARGDTSLKPHSLDEFLAKGDGAPLGSLSAQALEVSCSGCGAVVVFEPPEVAGNCSFCGANLVAQPKAADPLVAPDGVLPAKVPKETAQAEVCCGSYTAAARALCGCHGAAAGYLERLLAEARRRDDEAGAA